MHVAVVKFKTHGGGGIEVGEHAFTRYVHRSLRLGDQRPIGLKAHLATAEAAADRGSPGVVVRPGMDLALVGNLQTGQLAPSRPLAEPTLKVLRQRAGNVGIGWDRQAVQIQHQRQALIKIARGAAEREGSGQAPIWDIHPKQGRAQPEVAFLKPDLKLPLHVGQPPSTIEGVGKVNLHRLGIQRRKQATSVADQRATGVTQQRQASMGRGLQAVKGGAVGNAFGAIFRAFGTIRSASGSICTASGTVRQVNVAQDATRVSALNPRSNPAVPRQRTGEESA